MSKASEYNPKYKLQKSSPGLEKIGFYRDGTWYVPNIPMFGMTTTQKVVLKWASEQKLPPVMTIIQEPTTNVTEDKEFPDPNEPRRIFCPKVQSKVALDCIGGRYTVMVYYCEIFLHVGTYKEPRKTNGTRVIFLSKSN